MPVIGTAGHVDHGKSTLVKALTGLEPDRWEEERRRGLTIDLGFAWMTLDDATEVSFIDVPGHEHFIKNMLSGIESIDVALLVVAGDEGWMPQTEEHVAILDLLDVRLGVVAVTKTDRLDDELVELAALEVDDRLAGTSLAGAPILPVSAVTGAGLETLVLELRKAVGDVPTDDMNRPRLWIDRSFTISGAGTVVTGTLLDGSLHLDDRIHIWPEQLEGRIRGLQSHENVMESVSPRRRVAVNLGGVDRSDLSRGAMLGRADQWAPTNSFLVAFRMARYAEELTDRGAYHVHIGAGSWPARIRIIGDGMARVDIAVALPLTIGDRFVIRDTGRRLVVAGGRVLDPAPPHRGNMVTPAASRLAKVVDASPDDRAMALLDVRGIETTSRLAAHTGGGTIGRIATSGFVYSSAWAESRREEVTTRLSEFHSRNPLRPGMPLASLASSIGVDAAVIVQLLAGPDESGSDVFVVEASTVRLAGFGIALSDDDQHRIAAVTTRLIEAGWAVPRVSELDIDPEAFHGLIRDGTLTRVNADFFYPTVTLAGLRGAIGGLEEPFTVSEFKDHLGISRKYAVPLLEWSDLNAITIRTGEHRRLR